MIDPDEIAAKLKFSFRPEKPLEFFPLPEMGVVLTRVTAAALLADLPMLQALLEEVAKAPAKPSTVQ